MGARKKKKCMECNRKANLSYDPRGELCVDCLTMMKDELLRKHQSGEMTYQDAERILMKRLRFSRFQAEKVLFPPLGEGDFHDPRMDIKLRFEGGLLE